MVPLIERILGANWRTSLTGIGSALSGLLAALAAAPYELGNVAELIPPAWKAKLFFASAVSAFILRSWNSSLQKDKQVTGGEVRQPEPVVPRDSGFNRALIAFLIPAFLFSGCQNQAPETKAKWAQTGEFLAQRAMSIAGRVVLNAAVASLSDRDADFLDSAAAGLRAETPNILTASDVARVVAIWTPADPRFDKLGVQLADTFHEANRAGDKPATVEAIAVGLNRAAANDRLP